MLKFMFSKRPQKMTKSSPCIWHLLLSKFQIDAEYIVIFLAFLEHMFFKTTIGIKNLKNSYLEVTEIRPSSSSISTHNSLLLRSIVQILGIFIKVTSSTSKLYPLSDSFYSKSWRFSPGITLTKTVREGLIFSCFKARRIWSLIFLFFHLISFVVGTEFWVILKYCFD